MRKCEVIFLVSFITEVIMNKKQLLSIAMLLSVTAMNANPFIPAAASAFGALAGTIKTSSDRADQIIKLKQDNENLVENCKQLASRIPASHMESATETVEFGRLGQAWAATKNGAGQAWNGVKAAPFVAYSGIKSGAGFVKAGASDLYTFAKANPTTFGVRTGAVAGAGYVVYRNAGKVWNKIKENPKTTAALVAAGVLGYYKGDVALAAAKTAFAKLPATPESVVNAGNTVYSYVPSVSTPEFVKTSFAKLPATPEFVTTAAEAVVNNPYTSAAYAAAGVQGITDYVGLAGSNDDEDATETEMVDVTTSARHGNLFSLNNQDGTVKLTDAVEGMSNFDQRVKLLELRNWVVDMNISQFVSAIDAKIAELV